MSSNLISLCNGIVRASQNLSIYFPLMANFQEIFKACDNEGVLGADENSPYLPINCFFTIF